MKWRHAVKGARASGMTRFINTDIELALNYARAATRPRVAAVFALDEALGQIVATVREPLLAQIRLAWWREQLEAAGEPASPIARAIAPKDRASIAKIADGWAVLLDPLPLNETQLDAYARLRGGTIFDVMTANADSIGLGEGWALADFACRCSDQETARRALAMAAARLHPKRLDAVPRDNLPFGVLARLALGDVQDGLPRKYALGSRRRAARALLYALLRR